MPKLFDRLLDASVYFSFDRSGYQRHARGFDPADLAVDLAGRRILVTGGNSGLGKAAAHQLGLLGAEVFILCRDAERGGRALADLNEVTGSSRHRLELVDMASPGSIHELAARLGDLPVDVLIHNAGSLLDERRITPEGFEMTWATHVLGPALLTRLLRRNLEAAAPSRVVIVTSGGMYPQRLDLTDLLWEKHPFDGVRAYANAKRAQVIATELWAEELRGSRIDVNAMHPGWADTPGVQKALPGFWNFTKDRLRSPREGADTLVWLAAAKRLQGQTGKLFFDRAEAATYVFPWTRESPAEREALRRLLDAAASSQG